MKLPVQDWHTLHLLYHSAGRDSTRHARVEISQFTLYGNFTRFALKLLQTWQILEYMALYSKKIATYMQLL
jgi:hypothetical protein